MSGARVDQPTGALLDATSARSDPRRWDENVRRAGSALIVVVVVAGAGGCYRSHERTRADAGEMRADAGRDADGDAGRDAGLDRRDAGPRGGSHWTLEPREARVSFPHELGCTQIAGGSLAIRVTTAIDTECEHAGPVEVQARADGTFIVRAFAWIEHPPSPDACPGITDLMERTVLVTARAGLARAEDAFGSSRAEIALVATS